MAVAEPKLGHGIHEADGGGRSHHKDKVPNRRNVIRAKLTDKGQRAFEKVTKLKSIHGVISVLSEVPGHSRI